MTNRDHSPSVAQNDGGDAKLRTEGSGLDLDALGPIRALVEYAADVRWAELANGETFTVIDRLMLRELHTRARVASAVLAATTPPPPSAEPGATGSDRGREDRQTLPSGDQ